MAVADADIRRRQYADALARWVAAPIANSRIVVVENSLACKEALRDALDPSGAAEAVDFRVVPTPVDTATRGKGAAEAVMLDDAFRQLAALSDPPTDADLVYKVTGRLFLRGAQRVLPTGDGRRGAVVRATLDQTYVDTRVLGANPDVWRLELAGMAADVNESAGVFLEHVVAERLRSASARGELAVSRFNGRPSLVGVSGTTGTGYDGLAERARALLAWPVETLLRRLPPAKQF